MGAASSSGCLSASIADRMPRLWMAATAVAMAAAAAIFTWGWSHRSAVEAQQLRFTIDPPPDTRFTIRYAATAISPSGRLLVFAAARGSIRVRYGFDGWIS